MALLSSQFDPPGDDQAKDSLRRQLRESFRKRDLAWLDESAVRVEPARRVPADQIDWSGYPDWEAAHQLKAVRKVARKIHKGKEKPTVLTQAPDGQKVLMDGHHHALGAVDANVEPLAYVVRVPSKDGPWVSLHDKQTGDHNKDDFKSK